MKNALLGYTYQHYVALLLLAKMDVERNVDIMTLEAKVAHQFDDISLEIGGYRYYLQIKDFENISLTSLRINGNEILINKTPHRLSADTNLLFFRHIDYIPNGNILGFPAYETSGVYIVSLNRAEIDRQINSLYRKHPYRKAVMDRFFAGQLDKRSFRFEKDYLPDIAVYNTRLSEPTVKISRKIHEFKDILFIEGRPGIGKSHLVGVLQQQFKNHLLYRFWISNQDAQYEERLKYANFLTDLSKQLFHDYKDHSEEDIFKALQSGGRLLLLDGLDHVENYNKKDLEQFLSFIDRVRVYCRTIVLSRPLQMVIGWKKQVLLNWNERQTLKVLKELYQIDDHTVTRCLYSITGGYPILIRYTAKQYQRDGQLPTNEKFDSIDSYYHSLLRNEKGKQALSVFLCTRGFLMQSELQLFLDAFPLGLVEEFIEEHPYLFELRLNRIALFHDSLITYLRKSGINFTALQIHMNQVVCGSLLKGEKRFQSRIGHLDLSMDQIKTIVRWYASMKNFRAILNGVVDFEAVREFYQQLRELLVRLSPADLDLAGYYDFVLIYNISQRNFISNVREFQYTYVRTLLFNGYTEEDITSSKYLFAMLYYVKTQDATLLLNEMSDESYDTDDFYRRLDQDLRKENNFFEFQQAPFTVQQINKVLKDTTAMEYRAYLGYVLINLYLHEANRQAFPELYAAIKAYMEGHENKGAGLLTRALANRIMEDRQSGYVLRDAQKELLALGIHPAENDYLNLSLKEYLTKHGSKGNFDLWPEMLSYLRLSLHRGKKIDIASISTYWPKYHQRYDTTLYAIDQALAVFEQKGWIAWQASVNLITHIQEISEKGYRGLLARYLMAHEPTFLLTVLAEFAPEDLHISWFDLEPRYLDALPDEVYSMEIHRLMGYHRDRKIPAENIDSLLTSNKLPLLQKDLKRYVFQLSVEDGAPIIPQLEQYGLSYVKLNRDPHGSSDNDPEKRFDQGILDDQNAYFIKQKQLSPGQVAGFSDANYWALGEPQLFRQFPNNVVKRDLKGILFSALTSRSRHGEYHLGTWEMPGSILKILTDHNVAIPKSLFDSFLDYLKLSLVDFEPNNVSR